MHTRENELWLLVKQDHRPSFNILYEETVGMLHTYGNRFSKDQEVIEESIQQVYIYFWFKRAQIEIQSSFRFYLLKAFRRLLLKKIKEKRKKEPSTFDTYLKWTPSCEDKIIASEYLSEKKRHLEKAAQSLSPRQREALFLKFDQGLKSHDIAAIMGLQTPGVYKLVSTALIRLRKVFQE